MGIVFAETLDKASGKVVSSPGLLAGNTHGIGFPKPQRDMMINANYEVQDEELSTRVEGRDASECPHTLVKCAWMDGTDTLRSVDHPSAAIISLYTRATSSQTSA